MLSFALSVYLFSLSLYWYANIKSNAHDILYFVGLILIDTTQYTLQHTATHYIILQSTAIHYNTLQHTTILHVCFMFWRWLSWPCRFWFRNVSSPCLQTHYIVVKDPHLSDQEIEFSLTPQPPYYQMAKQRSSVFYGLKMTKIFITCNSSVVPLIEGLCSANPWEFKFSGCRRNRTDDLGINSPLLRPTEPRLHVRSTTVCLIDEGGHQQQVHNRWGILSRSVLLKIALQA